MKKVIRGGTVVNASESVRADVLIDGETIAGVGSFEGVDAELIDASGCYVLPGAIDNHTHLSMPFGGTTTADDYDTGTQAAAAGGTTCLVDFALQMEPNGLRSSLEEWMGRAAGAAHVDYGFHMAITNADAATIADMAAIVGEGVASFKVFLAYPNVLMVTDDQFLAVLERARDLDALTMVHCENGFAIQHLVQKALAAGEVDPIYHALTRPEEMEAEATGRALRLAGFAARRCSSCTSPAGSRPRRSWALAHTAPPPTARPASSTSSTRSTTCAGRTSRARASSARHPCATPPTSPTSGMPCASITSRSSRPTTARSTTSRSASASETSRRSRTGWPRSSIGCRCCGSTACATGASR